MNETPLKADTDKGFALHGSLYLKSNAPSDAVIILCHGLGSTKNSETIRHIAENLKYHMVTFDFQGNGESGGSTAIGNLYDEVENLRCVISYVRSTLKREILGICGRSKGAAVVLLYASIYNDVPLVINLSARYDYPDPDYVKKAFPDKLEKLEKDGFFVWEDGPGDYIVRKEDLITRSKIDMSCVKNINKEKVRVLTVHGSKDEVCPVDGAYTYDKLIGPEPHHKLIIIEGADHRFKNQKDELLKAVESWLFENQSWHLGK
ncbi:11839_t:CDS:1 [Dentiscutata erythropus]|uniref:11839_t:CDS:1 n=1 Tax=Dentiscutata erythropus TaxID=1348616 RepID=A0A9N9AMU2_9GLOM|nr:11839_t:CDS:1 [Dentiscutata erythropus]